MITLEQSKFVCEMRWVCDKITGVIDEYYKVEHRPCSYLMVYEISDNFKVKSNIGEITFAIRRPGSTIGYIKCTSYGLITEAEFYKDSCINDDYSICNTIKNLVQKDFIASNELYKIEFVEASIKNSRANKIGDTNKVSEKILWFVANFVYAQGYNNADCISNQFRAGYCLHFAIILKNMFKEGEICWCAPFGHIAYVQDGIPYDIEGVCTSDCEYYIPISYIKEGIRDFVRIPGVGFNASEEYIQDAIRRYKQDNIK